MNRFFDAGVSPATANIAAHKGLNFLVRRVRIGFEQGSGGHDLSRLAVAALRHIYFEPCFLDGVISIFGQPFDSRDRRFFADGRYGRGTRPSRHTVQMHGASPAHRHATAVFGADHLQVVAQNPEQRGVGGDVDLPLFAVDVEIEFFHCLWKF